jgi:hypothetical protein
MCANDDAAPGKNDMLTEQSAGPPGKRDTTPVRNALEPELQDHIGMQLRSVYDEVLNEPVPDRFLKLLAELERKQADKP